MTTAEDADDVQLIVDKGTTDGAGYVQEDAKVDNIERDDSVELGQEGNATKTEEGKEAKKEYEKPPGCYAVLKEGGHWKSMILTPLCWFLLLGTLASSGGSGVIGWFAGFLIFYIIYIVECYMCTTWKYLKNQETGDGTVSLLDKWRQTKPNIRWYYECYHYEEYYVKPQLAAKVVVWVGGDLRNAGVLQTAGYQVECFQYASYAYNYIRDMNNRKQTGCVIVNAGAEGSGVEREILRIWEIKNDEVLDIIPAKPKFVRWTGSEEALTRDCVSSNVLVKQRKKVVTHTAETYYDFGNWTDISGKYPSWDHVFTQLKCTSSYEFGNSETRRDHAAKKQQFCDANKRDDHQSFYEYYTVAGFKPKMLVRSGEAGTKEFQPPFWMTVTGYWVFSVFLLTLYPRYKLSSITGKKSWDMVKTIST